MRDIIRLITNIATERYEHSETHKYNEGDVLMLNGDWSGYGSRPIATILGYEMSEDVGGQYRVSMTRNIEIFVGTPYEERTSSEELHFKWNIEHQFMPIPQGMSDDAAASLYDIDSQR